MNYTPNKIGALLKHIKIYVDRKAPDELEIISYNLQDLVDRAKVLDADKVTPANVIKASKLDLLYCIRNIFENYLKVTLKGSKSYTIGKFENKDGSAIRTRDYFAAKAMLAVMQETQEMRTASFWDWIKHILYTAGCTFLVVKFKEVDEVYEEAARRAYKYADAMLKIKQS